MAFFVGVFLALGVGLFASFVGFDRDRAFYPTVLLVVASYYDLFAVMGGSLQALILETSVIVVFVFVSAIGFKTNLWLVAGALAAHGVFDVMHSGLISNAGVPAWWPIFCSSYDIVAALYLAWLLSRSIVPAQAPAVGRKR